MYCFTKEGLLRFDSLVVVNVRFSLKLPWDSRGQRGLAGQKGSVGVRSAAFGYDRSRD